MEITHRTNNVRIAPRKLRLVADQMRHQNVATALGVLPLVTNRGAEILYKSLNAAIDVAKDRNLDLGSLVIQRVWCDEGRKLKRSIHHSRGRSAMIMKQSSHLSIMLKGEPKARTRKKAATVEEEK